MGCWGKLGGLALASPAAAQQQLEAPQPDAENQEDQIIVTGNPVLDLRDLNVSPVRSRAAQWLDTISTRPIPMSMIRWGGLFRLSVRAEA